MPVIPTEAKGVATTGGVNAHGEIADVVCRDAHARLVADGVCAVLLWKEGEGHISAIFRRTQRLSARKCV